MEAPCGHLFDAGCMETIFVKATLDESLYPPRCCQPILAASVRQYLDASKMLAFDKKALEFDTPAPDRVYCCRKQCSAFLGHSTSTPVPVSCTNEDCSSQTCGSCRKEGHGSTSCPNSEREELEFVKIADDLHEKNGWTRCYSCRHLVEKSEGCYHMTCVCKAQFCYLCGTPWKECDCPQFEIPAELQD